MLLPSRLDATIPVSDSRTSWFDTACCFIPNVLAMALTFASPLLMRWWRSRSRVSLANTFKSAMTLTASTNERRGRLVRLGRGGQQAAAPESQQLSLLWSFVGFRAMTTSPTTTITLYRVTVLVNRSFSLVKGATTRRRAVL